MIPKLRRSDSNRYESLSSDESSDHGKKTGNDLSCCGKAISIPKLPKISRDKHIEPRTIKSAESLISKMNLDLIQNSQIMSKSADTRKRRVSDVMHSSPRITEKLKDSLSLVNPNLRLQNSKLQESNIVNNEKELLFKSQSLLVLPSIKKQTEEISNVHNPVLNLTSPNQVDVNIETSCLIFADDHMVEDYLQEQISNGEEESVSVSSSSCATSSGSDLFSFTSQPHSLSDHVNINNQITSKLTNELTDLSNRSECIKSLPDKNNALENCNEVSPKIEHDEPNLFPSNYSNLMCNFEKDDLEKNIDSDYSTENCPEVLSSVEYNEDCSKDDTFIEDSLDQENSSTLKPREACNKRQPQKSISENNNTETFENVNGSKKFQNLKKKVHQNRKTIKLLPAETLNNIKSSYPMRESSESDTMSWLDTSVDQSSYFSDKPIGQKTSMQIQYSPHLALQKRLEEKLGSFINQSIDEVDEVDDGFSDSSDDDLPRKVKNYRYQDEIKSISSTLDLSATIPATPPVNGLLR